MNYGIARSLDVFWSATTIFSAVTSEHAQNDLKISSLIVYRANQHISLRGNLSFFFGGGYCEVIIKSCEFVASMGFRSKCRRQCRNTKVRGNLIGVNSKIDIHVA